MDHRLWSVHKKPYLYQAKRSIAPGAMLGEESPGNIEHPAS